MLTNIKVARLLKGFGYGKIPSGCYFNNLDKELHKELVIVPDTPMPKIFYFESDDNGDLVSFKSM